MYIYFRSAICCSGHVLLQIIIMRSRLNRRTRAKLKIVSKKQKILAARAALANAGSAAKKNPFLPVLI